jgi:hypothetical protein
VNIDTATLLWAVGLFAYFGGRHAGTLDERQQWGVVFRASASQRIHDQQPTARHLDLQLRTLIGVWVCVAKHGWGCRSCGAVLDVPPVAEVSES